MKRRLCAITLALWAGAAAALSATVIRVSDGDTLWVRLDDRTRKPLKLRLEGIDAPERCQAGGEQARSALAAQVLGRRVDVARRARDSYARTLARVELDGQDLGAWMVRQGHAWSYRFRQHPGPYAALEQQARAARRGVFAQSDAIEPRRFRQLHGPCP